MALSMRFSCFVTKATNITFEGKQCGGQLLTDLGHKMGTSGYF